MRKMVWHLYLRSRARGDVFRGGGSPLADPFRPSHALQTAFIKQEALEKAREIKVKADEEFAIEKASHGRPLSSQCAAR